MWPKDSLSSNAALRRVTPSRPPPFNRTRFLTDSSSSSKADLLFCVAMQLLKIRRRGRPGTVAIRNTYSYKVFKWSFSVCVWFFFIFNPIFSCSFQILLSMETLCHNNVFISRSLSPFQDIHSCVCALSVTQLQRIGSTFIKVVIGTSQVSPKVLNS